MKPLKRTFLIAVTGGIASGKSIVCKWFEDKGFTVHYADKIAQSILEKDQIKEIIAAEFGKFLLVKGKIDRKKLGDLVFHNRQKLQILNKLIHPEVKNEIQRLIDSSRQDFLIFEIPLLFESTLEKAFDFVINVYSDKKVQIERLVKLRSINEKKAQKIINSQLPGETKINGADLTIFNNGKVEEIIDQLVAFEMKMLNLSHQEISRISDL